MAGTIMTAMFWVSQKLKQHQLQDNSTQTFELKIDESTQIGKIQAFEKSTQTIELKSDAGTQVEKIQFDSKTTQTIIKMHEKSVQTSIETSGIGGIETPPSLFLDKKDDTRIIPNAIKVTMPVKKPIPRSKIPLTTEFRNYLERKDAMCEEQHGIKILKLPSHDKLEIRPRNADHNITEDNSSKICFLPSGDDESTLCVLKDEATTNMPVPIEHEYMPGYIKLKECKEKQSRFSRFRAQLAKLRKLFKK